MNDLTKQLMCVVMRNGVELWLEDDRAVKLKLLLVEGKTQFIEYDGELLNRADIVGVFKAPTMEELIRRKNGQWKCKYNIWHEKHTECACYYDQQPQSEYNTTEEISEKERQRNLSAIAGLREQFFARDKLRRSTGGL